MVRCGTGFLHRGRRKKNDLMCFHWSDFSFIYSAHLGARFGILLL